MRAMTVVAFAGVVLMSLVGCGGTEMQEHVFTHEPGAAVTEQAKVSRGFSSDGASTQVEGQVSASGVRSEPATQGGMEKQDFCSGSCNTTVCTCTGSYECCSAGCRACFEVANQT